MTTIHFGVLGIFVNILVIIDGNTTFISNPCLQNNYYWIDKSYFSILPKKEYYVCEGHSVTFACSLESDIAWHSQRYVVWKFGSDVLFSFNSKSSYMFISVFKENFKYFTDCGFSFTNTLMEFSGNYYFQIDLNETFTYCHSLSLVVYPKSECPNFGDIPSLLDVALFVDGIERQMRGSFYPTRLMLIYQLPPSTPQAFTNFYYRYEYWNTWNFIYKCDAPETPCQMPLRLINIPKNNSRVLIKAETTFRKFVIVQEDHFFAYEKDWTIKSNAWIVIGQIKFFYLVLSILTFGLTLD